MELGELLLRPMTWHLPMDGQVRLPLFLFPQPYETQRYIKKAPSSRLFKLWYFCEGKYLSEVCNRFPALSEAKQFLEVMLRLFH